MIRYSCFLFLNYFQLKIIYISFNYNYIKEKVTNIVFDKYFQCVL